jgi:hypothetical protein
LLAAIGASVYQKISANLSTTYDQRTSVLYVAEKLRQNDHPNSVRVDTLDGSDALVITQQFNGENYETWLYVSDSELKEALLAPGTPASPELGQSIMPMSSMKLDGSRLGQGLLGVDFTTASGEDASIVLFLKTAQGGGN